MSAPRRALACQAATSETPPREKIGMTNGEPHKVPAEEPDVPRETAAPAPNWREEIELGIEATHTHIRPYVTPLSKERPDLNKVILVGSGSYVMLGAKRIILTCAHVARHGE